MGIFADASPVLSYSGYVLFQEALTFCAENFMNDCWAACLGDCSDKISREHIISANLFPSDKIMVQGLSFCRNEPKEIGLAALTKKILCTRHNRDLSEIDAAAGESMNTLREATRLSNVRVERKIRYPRVIRYKIHGPSLERWFLKTFINVVYKQTYPIGSPAAKLWVPSADLVEIAFQRKSFNAKAGLYFLGELGEQIQSTDRIRATTYVDETGCLVGAVFYFHGFRFLLYIDPSGPRERLHLLNSPTGSGPVRPVYHLSRIRSVIGKHLSHVIEIRW
jgi:hypothetical protein